MDVVFISPNNASGVYQSLSNRYSAIEPPTWALLLAESCRSIGYKCAILDTLAENLNDEQSLKKIEKINPKIIVFTVYGQNVNSGTTSMSGATRLSNFLKNNGIKVPIVYIGSHVQALPIETLNKELSIDIILTNEGVYSLRNLLAIDDYSDVNLENIKGICFRRNGVPYMTLPEKIVPQARMDIDLPGYAFDLLPFRNRPFDLYRSPLWHAEYNEDFRTPYAAIQTSLGCMFGCNFCMINILNRNDNDEIGVASNYSGMRYWSRDFILNEFKKLIDLGVKTIRVIDEMFLLNPKFYIPLCEKLLEYNRDDSLRLWAYSRVDTVKNHDILSLIRKAGFKWLALGIESSQKNIRLEVSKGKFQEVDIENVVNHIHNADIEVMANYIYGLPGDNLETMNETLELSKKLLTLGWNTYAAMPLPGSQLYKSALEKGLKLPNDYEAYSFHSYNSSPLATKELQPWEILKFRDQAFYDYHSYKPFLSKLEKKYGNKAVKNVTDMLKINIKRKIIEEAAIL